MKAKFLLTVVLMVVSMTAMQAQPKQVYDDSADPMKQIQTAVEQAAATGKNVICQVGGNWCPWCLRFAAFITEDAEIAKLVEENFVYVHINNQHKNAVTGRNEPNVEAMARLGNPGRFGYPVMVVLDGKGNILHFQDSSYLEEGKGYNKSKVVRFFKNWTPTAIAQ